MKVFHIVGIFFFLLTGCGYYDGPNQPKNIVVSGNITLKGNIISSLEFPLGALRSADFDIYCDQSNVEIKIQDTKGKLRKIAVVSSDEIINQNYLGYYKYQTTIRTPDDGRWKLTFSQSSEAFCVYEISGDSDVALQVDTPTSRQYIDEPIIVSVRIKQRSPGDEGWHVLASLYHQEQLIAECSLQPIGTNSYSCSLPPVKKSIKTKLVITASKDNMQRQATIELTGIARSARIVDIDGENLIDQDGDGLAEQLIIEVNIELEKAMRISLDGHLEGKDGEIITFNQFNSAVEGVNSGTTGYLAAGTQKIQLVYSGSQIFKSGINGPYSIRITLYDLDQGGLEVDVLRQKNITKGYLYTIFE